MSEDVPAIILDSRSSKTRAGYGGEDYPRCVIPSIVGRPRHEGLIKELCMKGAYVGDEVQCKRGVLALRHPIERGIVSNWEDMESIWRHTLYSELHASPEEHPIFLTEPPLNPKLNREKMIEIMFETFNCPATFIVIQSVLSLYAAGRTTGLVLDSGDDVTHIVPVYEGYPIPHAVESVGLAGRDVTDSLMRQLNSRGYPFYTAAEREIVRSVKEKMLYVKTDNWNEEIADNNETYELPDGQKLNLGKERFNCPEILFNPSLLRSELDGMHEMVNRSIRKCDFELYKDLIYNIVLAGGNTMLTGFVDRLRNEINQLTPPRYCCKVIAPPERYYLSWVGASILVSLSQFSQYWIKKELYEERGPSVVHEKLTI